jgi:NADH:ubiquinone oxidoreductase subunit 6 (subunit J)
MEVFFIISSIVAVAGAFLVVSQRVAIYSLLGLLISFAGTAGVYYSLDAGFVAVSQILIYAGAIAVLFLFVLMFASDPSPDASPLVTVESRAVFDPAKKPESPAGRPAPRLAVPSPLAALVALCALVVMYVAIYKLPPEFKQFGTIAKTTEVALTTQPKPDPKSDKAPEIKTEPVEFGSTRAISYATFEKFPLAFEVVSLLIFAAILGAVLLTRSQVRQLRMEAAPEDHDAADKHEDAHHA